MGRRARLEIDQFAVDCVEIIKGPAALSLWFDAIGELSTCIAISRRRSPFEGKTELFMRSVNESLGLSVRVAGKEQLVLLQSEPDAGGLRRL